MTAPALFSTYVQSGSNGAAAGSGNTSLGVTLTNTKKGNTLLVFFHASQAIATSASDGTNTYNLDYSNTSWDGASSGNMYAYSAVNTVGGTLTIAVNFSADFSPQHVLVVEHRNLLPSPFDKSAATSGNTNTTPFGSGATSTLSQSTELIVLLAATFNGDSTATPQSPFIHNTREATAEATFALNYADALVNTTAAQSGSVTWGSGGFSCGVGVLTYKYTNGRLISTNNLRPAIFKPGLAR